MEQSSKSWDIGQIVMSFCAWCLLKHINLPAKNEQNLPCGFGDRPLATAWQPEWNWGSGGIIWDLWRHWWHHCTHGIAHDVIPTFYRTGSLSWVCHILNCSNQTIIKGDLAIFVTSSCNALYTSYRVGLLFWVCQLFLFSNRTTIKVIL